MRVSFIGHASILVEAAGIRILSDPWWKGPCFGAQWWVYPPADLTPLVGRPVDYVYVSHGHHDHFHPTTLASLDGTPTMLVCSETDMAGGLCELGYEVIAIAPDEERDVGNGVGVRILPTSASPGSGSDSLMGIQHEDHVVLNLNDAVHALEPERRAWVVAWLKRHYPEVDDLFCGYGTASYFPNCIDIPGKDDLRTATRRQEHFNRVWSDIVHAIAPRDAFPFAADVALLQSELIHLNEAVHAARPTDLFRALHPEATTRTHDMAPGFAIEDGEVIRNVLRTHVSREQIERDMPDEIQRANTVGHVSAGKVDRLVRDLRENAARLAPYLSTFRGDYRCFIELANSEQGVVVEKRGRELRIDACPLSDADRGGFDVVLETRATYLQQSLNRPFGHEVIFVGSGGLFRYRSRAGARRGIHHELRVLISRHGRMPERWDAGPRWLRAVKSGVKSLLGRREEEGLYDLLAWTVFQGRS